MSLNGKLVLLLCSIWAIQASIVMKITNKQGAYLEPNMLSSKQEYLLEISGNNIDSLSDIDIKGLDQWYARQQASYTTINSINGKTERSCHLTYSIKPKKHQGPFVLGPACIRHQAQLIESNTIQGMLTESSQENHTLQHQEIVLKMSANYHRWYVHQPLVINLKLYVPLRINVAECSTPVVNQLPPFSLVREYIHKKKYRCVEWRTYFTPQKEGRYTIPSAQLSCMVHTTLSHNSLMQAALRNFGFGAEQNDITSNPITIEVQSLPDSSIDAIGDFSNFSASVSDESITLNNALTYKLMLKGGQELETLCHPSLKNIEDFKVHSSTISVDKNQSSKVFEYVLQPLKQGVLIIPEQEFCFLNPKDNKVHTIATNACEIRVYPAPAKDDMKKSLFKIIPVNHSWQYVPWTVLSIPMMLCIMILLLIIVLAQKVYLYIFKFRLFRKKYALRKYKKRLNSFDKPEELEMIIQSLVGEYYGLAGNITIQDCYEFGSLFTDRYKEKWRAFVDKSIAARYWTTSDLVALKKEAWHWLHIIKEQQ